jgi:hypothetical protein
LIVAPDGITSAFVDQTSPARFPIALLSASVVALVYEVAANPEPEILTEEPILAVEGVSVIVGTAKILDGINVDIIISKIKKI